jgi:hypothetical protein
MFDNCIINVQKQEEPQWAKTSTKVFPCGYPNSVRNAESDALIKIYLNHNSIRKQNAIKLASIIPSLLFFDPIRPIRLLIPGTWLAAPTILL